MSDGATSPASEAGATPIRGVPYVEGRHWVSPFNFRPEITETYDFPQPLALIDNTIRKFVYTAGVRPTIAQVLKAGELLQDLGVRAESLNVNWFGENEPVEIDIAVAEAVAKAGFAFAVNVYTDTMVGDGSGPMALMPETLERLAAARVTAVSPGLLQARDAGAEARQAEQFAALAEQAARCGIGWTVTVANCGRRDFESMIRGTNVAIAAGAERVDLMDSTSALNPDAMKLFVRAFRAGLSRPVPITMHHHDDFGMATAGTIAAVTAGASPDVALNGVSYRSGFAALEEVVVALDVLYGLDTGIRLDRLQSASDALARLMDFPVPPLKPLVGAHQFLSDNPNQIAHLAKVGPDAFPQAGCSINPSLIGSQARWVWGKESNDTAVRVLAAKYGVTIPNQHVRAVRQMLDERLARLTAYPKWLAPEEVESVIREAAQAFAPRVDA